jgi:hypothetical protein
MLSIEAVGHIFVEPFEKIPIASMYFLHQQEKLVRDRPRLGLILGSIL